MLVSTSFLSSWVFRIQREEQHIWYCLIYDKYRLIPFHIFLFLQINVWKNLRLKLLISKNSKKCQWADLNRRPRRYECRALTNWATLTWIISYYFIALLSNDLINVDWIKMYIFQLIFLSIFDISLNIRPYHF